MGCKQYARMLGLSRGYPYILYLSLSKWDAAPSPGFSTRSHFRPRESVARCSRATRICHGSVACQVAVQIGPLTPASRLGPSSGASDLKWKNFACSAGALLNGGTHGYVDVLENFPGRDSQRAVGGFHKIVASLSAMFTSERIPELQGTGELPGPDQKSRPIDLPFVFCFPHFIPPLGEGRSLELVVGKTQFPWLDFL